MLPQNTYPGSWAAHANANAFALLSSNWFANCIKNVCCPQKRTPGNWAANANAVWLLIVSPYILISDIRHLVMSPITSNTLQTTKTLNSRKIRSMKNRSVKIAELKNQLESVINLGRVCAGILRRNVTIELKCGNVLGPGFLGIRMRP